MPEPRQAYEPKVPVKVRVVREQRPTCPASAGLFGCQRPGGSQGAYVFPSVLPVRFTRWSRAQAGHRSDTYVWLSSAGASANQAWTFMPVFGHR